MLTTLAFVKAPTYIVNPSPYISVLIPIVKDLALLSGLFAVAVSFTFSFLATNEDGFINKEYFRFRKSLIGSLIAWIFFTILSGGLTLANLLAIPLPSAFDLNSLRSYFFQTGIGQSQSYSMLFIFISILIALASKQVRALMALFIFAMLGMLSPVFESHATALGSHGLVIGSLFYHVTFALLWVGGLIGLLLLSAQQRVIALPRFSRIAFWSANAVVVTGVVNAYTRFAKPSEIFSFYGLILSFKVIFTVGIIYFGYRQRALLSGIKHLNQLTRSKENEGEIESLNSSAAMVKSREWLVQELFLMLTTFILGGWLSTLTPPTPQVNTLPTPALDITGEQMPAAPNLARLFWMYRPDVIFLGALILGSILYYVGVRTLVKRGDKWPIGRTISFIIFIGLTDYATSGGLGIYARFAFSFHMIAHMLIGMVAPIFFVLSAPITLALRTLPSGRVENEKGLRQALMGVIHSRYVTIITHPLLALAFLDGSLFVLYFTPLFGTLMHSHVGHILMSVHFFAAGALFFYVIIGVDPNPRNTPFIARIVLVFAAMSIHAFFSIALLGTSTLLDGGYFASLERPWHLNLLADQHLGGSIGWSLSEVPILLALVATFIQWNRADDKEQKRIERAEIRARESGEKDELDLYNDYLKRLNEANER